ncbi:MAG TPA: hypothetical protein VMH02_06575, partial [Verrucomicrobiae bacterium]|nr:hypothetical protein [Verrucomicrobiae bacterium]
MKKGSLATKLAALYAALLGVTVLIVILASSIALVLELKPYVEDIIVAKHEEARFLADQYERQGLSIQDAAPDIVNHLSGIGARVTVFDAKGHYVAGDKALRPHLLDIILSEPPGNRPPPSAFRHGAPLPDPGREAMTLTQVDGGFVAFQASLPLILITLLP